MPPSICLKTAGGGGTVAEGPSAEAATPPRGKGCFSRPQLFVCLFVRLLLCFCVKMEATCLVAAPLDHCGGTPTSHRRPTRGSVFLRIFPFQFHFEFSSFIHIANVTATQIQCSSSFVRSRHHLGSEMLLSNHTMALTGSFITTYSFFIFKH